MEELQLKTINLVPAKIEFNKESIVKELNETLKKYDNLVFTEENTKDIRKVLAELRKGKTAADEFRKEKKKEASAPITAFEKEMKSIVKMFDDVINPINEQLQEFEDKRKREKQEEVETIISETVESLGLETKFANKLDVDEQYLTKNMSINQVKETTEFRANNLLNEQKLEIMNRENVDSFVKLKNSEHEMNLSVVAYLSQLEFKDVEAVKQTIEQDVQKELDERARKEVEYVNEQTSKEEWREGLRELYEETKNPDIAGYTQSDAMDDLPFRNIEETNDNKEYDVIISVTEDERLMLEEFLRDNNYVYQTIVKELPF